MLYVISRNNIKSRWDAVRNMSYAKEWDRIAAYHVQGPKFHSQCNEEEKRKDEKKLCLMLTCTDIINRKLSIRNT